ncbi:MAG TPA: GTPase ObgE [Candidatus Binatia bacterium]|jgi:GTP-binding protein|nr:GTPase ObgE [Candidatus Binatia bacterium]
MHFVDEVRIRVKAGDGGRGCVSFLREKYRPRGGPNGGNGGDGGSVILRADPQLSTLSDLVYQHHLRAERGEHGRGKDQHGKNGSDLIVRVPLGTLVRDAESGELLADLDTRGKEVVVAKGGRGGKGNAFFASSTNQAPRFAQPGLPGEERTLQLELRLLADVGLVGFPNAGKSTLLSSVSAARPRIADFPFTTLTPHLGVVRYGEEGSFVMADIPGLIEGAHQGHGLGVQFLRHLSRTSVLLHLLDISDPERDPLHDYDTINHELACFDPELLARPQLVAVTKLDLPMTRERLSEVKDAFTRRSIALMAVSAVTGEGLPELLWQIVQILEARKAEAKGKAGEHEQWV